MWDGEYMFRCEFAFLHFDRVRLQRDQNLFNFGQVQLLVTVGSHTICLALTFLRGMFILNCPPKVQRENGMTERQSPSTNHIYSIALMKEDSEWCVYQVKITGGIQRDFFVETVASRIPRGDSIKRIESMCESNFDRLPQDGGVIHFNL
jgi:hypothetical protein